MDLTLPLDHKDIERILPHGFPFLLVDRVIEFERDKRIVGVKNVSRNDRYLSSAVPGRPPALAMTILTEAVAQVGAILIMVNSENRDRIPLFTGIQNVRYYGAVHPGDVVILESSVVRLHRRRGIFMGSARVDDKTILEGKMTCMIAPRPASFGPIPTPFK